MVLNDSLMLNTNAAKIAKLGSTYRKIYEQRVVLLAKAIEVLEDYYGDDTDEG